jgi:hypothetical protein
MEWSSSWEAKSRSDSQEIPPLLWNLRVHEHIHESLPLYPILSQINPYCSLLSYDNQMWTGRWVPIFWGNLQPPSCTLKMEAVYSFKTYVPTYSPQDRIQNSKDCNMDLPCYEMSTLTDKYSPQPISLRSNLILSSWSRGTRWCSWLRHYATSWKVVGSIPDKVTGFFN